MPHKDPEARRAYEIARREQHSLQRAQRYHAQPEIFRQRAIDYYHADLERSRERARAYDAAHREERRLKSAKRRQEHPDKVRAIVVAWREKYPERAQASMRKTRQAHPEWGRSYSKRRRAWKAGAAINDATPAQEREILASAKGRCAYCATECPTCRRGAHALTIDHIDALVNKGNNTASNFVAVCKSCNSKKGIQAPPVPVQMLLLTVAPPRKKKTS